MSEIWREMEMIMMEEGTEREREGGRVGGRERGREEWNGRESESIYEDKCRQSQMSYGLMHG